MGPPRVTGSLGFAQVRWPAASEGSSRSPTMVQGKLHFLGGERDRWSPLASPRSRGSLQRRSPRIPQGSPGIRARGIAWPQAPIALSMACPTTRCRRRQRESRIVLPRPRCGPLNNAVAGAFFASNCPPDRDGEVGITRRDAMKMTIGGFRRSRLPRGIERAAGLTGPVLLKLSPPGFSLKDQWPSNNAARLQSHAIRPNAIAATVNISFKPFPYHTLDMY